MTERPLHPDDELVELALGDIDEPRRSQLIRHLVECDHCRSAYDAIAVAVDAVLPAAPDIAPPVGFDQRVLTTIGAMSSSPPAAPRHRAMRGRLLVAAAAVVLALVGGAVAVSLWGGSESSEPPLAGDTSLLRTSDGDIVGTAAVSSIEGKPVVVISISDPAVGIPYHCRILLKGGRMVDGGRWTVDDPAGSTWITKAPHGDVVGMELVTDDGRVWSTAQMH